MVCQFVGLNVINHQVWDSKKKLREKLFWSGLTLHLPNRAKHESGHELIVCEIDAIISLQFYAHLNWAWKGKKLASLDISVFMVLCTTRAESWKISFLVH